MLSQNDLHFVLSELERELNLRLGLYPERIKNQKMTREQANLHTCRLIDAIHYLNGRMPKFDTTIKGCIQELQREIALRQRLYPRWIEEKLLTAGEARNHILLVEKAIEELKTHLPPDQTPPPVEQGRLF